MIIICGSEGKEIENRDDDDDDDAKEEASMKTASYLK
jgi:hypothetical protein